MQNFSKLLLTNTKLVIPNVLMMVAAVTETSTKMSFTPLLWPLFSFIRYSALVLSV